VGTLIIGEEEVALSALPLPRIAERCQDESARYARHLDNDPRFCFELFRRAIRDGDHRAWSAVYSQYTQNTPIVRAWVEGHSLFPATGEAADYFINRAFERMWSALDAEKFARFDSLAALLRYLKMCINSAITDYVRSRRREDLPLEEAYQHPSPAIGIEGLREAELWQMIGRRVVDNRERTALICRYGLGMKPNEIYADYPQLFGSVREVYNALQLTLRRLRRDEQLAAYLSGREPGAMASEKGSGRRSDN
jgi:DNA-directed RNA polymerase specialized sigma24 family protein